MKDNKLTLRIALISLIANIAVYFFLPNKIPHYNISNQIDGYSGKWPILLLPILPFLMYFLMKKLSKLDIEKKENTKAYNVGIFISCMTFVILNWAFVFIFFGVDINLWKFINIILGATCIVMGAVMPKVKRNSAFGIRTSWAVANDEVWEKTQKAGGKSFIVVGIIIIIAGIFKEPLNVISAVVAMFVYSVYVYIYSYCKYKETKKYVR